MEAHDGALVAVLVRSRGSVHRAVGALMLALSLACCGDDAQPRPPAVELLLGSGEASFEPASSGDTLTLYAGTQGGHHVWLSMRMRGFDTESVRMILDVIPEPPAPPAHTEVALRFTQRADSADDGLPYEFAGWPARVLAPECAVGKKVLLRVQLLDDAGHALSQELDVVAGEPRLPFSNDCTL